MQKLLCLHIGLQGDFYIKWTVLTYNNSTYEDINHLRDRKCRSKRSFHVEASLDTGSYKAVIKQDGDLVRLLKGTMLI